MSRCWVSWHHCWATFRLVQVEVAVLMLPFGFDVPEHIQDASGVDLLWQARSRCTIDVPAGATVGQALDAAAAELGITVLDEAGGGPVSTAVAGVAFYGPVDEGKGKGRLFYPVVGQDGSLRWDRPVAEVTFEQLAATSAAGLFDGDSHRVYLVPQVPGGWPVDVDWQTCLTVLNALVLALTQLDGVAGGIERVKSLVSGMAGVVRAQADDWGTRGGGLHDVAAVTARIGGDANRLATLLGVTAQEARTLAEGLARVPLGSSPLTAEQERLATVARWSLYAAVESALLLTDGGPDLLPDLIDEALRAARDPDVTPDDIARIFFRAANPHHDRNSPEPWVPPD